MFRNMIQAFQQLPAEVSTFLKRAVVLFIGWKLFYILVLIPREVPDAWLVRKTGEATASVLNVLYSKYDFYAKHTVRVRKYGNDTINATFSDVTASGGRGRIVGIYQACNALELMILYAGFIICFYGPLKRKLLFIVFGVLGLFALNVLRCVFLAWIVLDLPHYFAIAHKYVFNIVVYVLTFILWMFYVKGLKKKNETPATTS